MKHGLLTHFMSVWVIASAKHVKRKRTATLIIYSIKAKGRGNDPLAEINRSVVSQRARGWIETVPYILFSENKKTRQQRNILSVYQ